MVSASRKLVGRRSVASKESQPDRLLIAWRGAIGTPAIDLETSLSAARFEIQIGKSCSAGDRLAPIQHQWLWFALEPEITR